MADYSTLLRNHVTLTGRSIDRICLQAYVPKLQTVGLVCQYLRWQRGYAIPSSAAFGKIGDAYIADVHRFAAAHGTPVRATSSRVRNVAGRGGTHEVLLARGNGLRAGRASMLV